MSNKESSVRYGNQALQTRIQQGMLDGKYDLKSIGNTVKFEAKASFYEAKTQYSTETPQSRNPISSIGITAVNTTRSTLAANNDVGSQTAAATITAAEVTYAGFKAAQAVSPTVITVAKNTPAAISATVCGAVDVTKTVSRGAVTVARTVGAVNSGFVPLSTPALKAALLSQANATGLTDTLTSIKITKGVNQLKDNAIQLGNNVVTGYNKIKTGTVTAVKTVGNTVNKTCHIVHGIANGSIMTGEVAHNALKKVGAAAKKTGLKGLKAAGKHTAHGVVKGGAWAVKKGIPKAGNAAFNLGLGVGSALTQSNDMMLQGAGHGIKLANYSIKTAVKGTKLMGRSVKTSVRAVKNVRRGIAFIRQNGLKAAWARARQGMGKAFANAGKSVVQAIINGIKALGRKVLVPIIIIAVVIAAASGIITSPASAVGAIFGGIFNLDNGDGTYTEEDIRAFITNTTNGIPALRAQKVDEIVNYVGAKQLEYDIVRVKTDGREGYVEPTVEGISDIFYTEDELVNIIQPVFNAILLKDYELAPSQYEAQLLLTDIFDMLFRQTEVTSMEWCNGGGMHSCGHIHALGDCPNAIEGIHTEYTCAWCCRQTCIGHQGTLICGKEEHTHTNSECRELICTKKNTLHKHTDACYNQEETICGKEEHTHTAWGGAAAPGCYSITYCGGCSFSCSGYRYCGGHSVLTVTIDVDGLYELLYTFFEQPIEELESITNRTPEQDAELAELKDYYEICQEYIRQIDETFGTGLSESDLASVVWVEGTREGSQAVIDLALSQLGQVGGQPYWSFMGFSSRVEWCACFVSWCMNGVGHSEVRYSNCAAGGVPYFKSIGHWADGGYTDIAKGDVIFFDWDADDVPDHTGLVIGKDSNYIYTIEGNSGDAVRIKKYSINSSVIFGFGLMYY